MDQQSSEGLLEIRRIFKVAAGAVLAGCSVKYGKIKKSSKVRVMRKGKLVFEGTLESLKRFKENSQETAGLHCALGFAGFQNFHVGDEVHVVSVNAPVISQDAQWQASPPKPWSPSSTNSNMEAQPNPFKAPAATPGTATSQAQLQAQKQSSGAVAALEAALPDPNFWAKPDEVQPQQSQTESKAAPAAPVPMPRPELDEAYLASRKKYNQGAGQKNNPPDDKVDFEQIWGKRRT